MVTLSSLWIAILLSAVVVWIASAVVWMVLPHHKSDFEALPDEEAARATLGAQGLAPGIYNVPHLDSMQQMKLPDAQRRFQEGPVAFITVLPKGTPAMGGKMALTFAFYLLVSVVVAYVTSRALSPGADYLAVFRLAGVTAWLAHGAAVIPDAIWFGKPWPVVAKQVLDGLAYALLTAGIFGWLWPG